MTTRERFLSLLRQGERPAVSEPELPALRPARGSRLVEEFVAAAEAAGARVHRGIDPAALFAGRGEDEVGVSVAAYGLADTGSVVLRSAPDEPRARSLLPPVHVCGLSEENLLPGLAELFAELGATLPSSVAIITGPSRSADIEQQLTIGVHGPGELHIVLT
ncbi:MAG: LUD domain-containing protein [Gaiellaceae bacterium]